AIAMRDAAEFDSAGERAPLLPPLSTRRPYAQSIDTSMSHFRFRCLIRENSTSRARSRTKSGPVFVRPQLQFGHTAKQSAPYPIDPIPPVGLHAIRTGSAYSGGSGWTLKPTQARVRASGRERSPWLSGASRA